MNKSFFIKIYCVFLLATNPVAATSSTENEIHSGHRSAFEPYNGYQNGVDQSRIFVPRTGPITVGTSHTYISFSGSRPNSDNEREAQSRISLDEVQLAPDGTEKHASIIIYNDPSEMLPEHRPISCRKKCCLLAIGTGIFAGTGALSTFIVWLVYLHG